MSEEQEAIGEKINKACQLEAEEWDRTKAAKKKFGAMIRDKLDIDDDMTSLLIHITDDNDVYIDVTHVLTAKTGVDFEVEKRYKLSTDLDSEFYLKTMY